MSDYTALHNMGRTARQLSGAQGRKGTWRLLARERQFDWEAECAVTCRSMSGLGTGTVDALPSFDLHGSLQNSGAIIGFGRRGRRDTEHWVETLLSECRIRITASARDVSGERVAPPRPLQHGHRP